MYAVGHVALGYLTGKLVGRTLKEDIHIPMIWAISLLPDIDLLIPRLEHRGLTHSIILSFIVFLPFLITRARKTLPYFLASTTHPLIGDYLTGELQLLWPISNEWLEYNSFRTVGTLTWAYVEWTLFATLIIVLLLSKDYTRLFNSDKRNLVLSIPLCTIVLPILFSFPMYLPNTLILPHLTLLSIILLSISAPILHHKMF